jgi:hypothetical protein
VADALKLTDALTRAVVGLIVKSALGGAASALPARTSVTRSASGPSR